MKIYIGEKNCITDVPGVKVGHETLYEKLNEEETICTGVTAILPGTDNPFKEKVRAASHVINGYGKTAGLIQVDELGLLESPIMLTNTFSVGSVLQGTLQYMLEKNPEVGDKTSSINIVVGECNDSYLNSMRILAIKPEHAINALNKASSQKAEEGAVGAGKGMVCFEYKGGIGTASEVIEIEGETFTFGSLVLTNFGKRENARFASFEPKQMDTPDGSIMIIIATDAPLSSRQLKRIAKRASAGLSYTGSFYAHGSGDIAIAFTTANKYVHGEEDMYEQVTFIRDDHPIFNTFLNRTATIVERAILSSLKNAETTIGRKERVVEKAPSWDLDK